MAFERPIVDQLAAAMERTPSLIQVLAGPRQVGKSTAAVQLEERLGWPSQTASADAPVPHPPEWIETQWRLARAKAGRVVENAARAHPANRMSINYSLRDFVHFGRMAWRDRRRQRRWGRHF